MGAFATVNASNKIRLGSSAVTVIEGQVAYTFPSDGRFKTDITENVKGLVNLSNVKNIIQTDFSSAGENGYIVLDPMVLHAADYGVPQSRERVIFIGIKKKILVTIQKNSVFLFTQRKEKEI